MNNTAEVVVIGGGVMGCSALYHLTQLGVRDAILLEQGVLASGSTGRSQAILRMHYSNPVTSSMAWESMKRYRDFQEEVGHPSGYVNTGYVVIVGPEDRDAMEDNVAMQRSLGIDTSVVSPEDLLEIAPMLNVPDAGGLAFEPQSGYADPYLVTSGYAEAAQENGAQVRQRSPADSVNVEGRTRTLRHPPERLRHPHRNGPRRRRPLVPPPPPTPRLPHPLDPIRHQVIMVRRPERKLPSHPIVGDILQEFSFRPHSTDLTVIGVGEDAVTVDDYSQGVDPETVKDSMAKLVHRMPAMADGYFRGGWSGLFTITPDWHPVLDRVPGVDGLFCAVGFSGHGFKLGAMVGQLMSEMITQGHTSTIDISPLRATRFDEGRLLTSRYRYNVLA